jgi:hypothetical protein
MSLATHLHKLGLEVLPLHGERIKLVGLDRLTEEQARGAIHFARQNKARLLEELGEPPGLPARPCLGCGKPFMPKDENKVYCRAWCFNHMQVLQ